MNELTKLTREKERVKHNRIVEDLDKRVGDVWDVVAVCLVNQLPTQFPPLYSLPRSAFNAYVVAVTDAGGFVCIS